MKKSIALVLAVVLVLSFAVIGSATQEVRVEVDGRLVNFPDARPFIDGNQRTLVPLRFIAEELGAEVDWNGQKQEVTIQGMGKDIKLVIGRNRASVNGSVVTFDTQAILKDNRTFVPLRFISETLGVTVDWISNTNTVEITTGEAPCIPCIDNNINTIESLNLEVKEIASFGDLFNNIRTGTSSLSSYTNIVFITQEDLPIAEGETVIYDIEAFNDNRSLRVIQGTPPSAPNDTGLHFLLVSEKDKASRYRRPYVQFNRDLGNGRRNVEYAVVGAGDIGFDENFRDYKLEQAEYIVFRTIESDTVIALENPFK